MIVIDRTAQNEGMYIYPFHDAMPEPWDLATAGYIRVNIWEITNVKLLPSADVSVNMQLGTMGLAQTRQLADALEKAIELAHIMLIGEEAYRSATPLPLWEQLTPRENGRLSYLKRCEEGSGEHEEPLPEDFALLKKVARLCGY